MIKVGSMLGNNVKPSSQMFVVCNKSSGEGFRWILLEATKRFENRFAEGNMVFDWNDGGDSLQVLRTAAD